MFEKLQYVNTIEVIDIINRGIQYIIHVSVHNSDLQERHNARYTPQTITTKQ